MVCHTSSGPLKSVSKVERSAEPTKQMVDLSQRIARRRSPSVMRVFFSVGEPSGDLHGANLIRALTRRDPTLECVGYGGPKMAAAGCHLREDLTELAVMWFFRALLYLPRFWRLVVRADREFRHHRPDAVVLIDYPGFNWWIARRARVHRIPVFYYGAPQMWAWASWRVHKMRRLVDHVLCKLPFEAEWYQQRHCPATYIGHPYFDELARQQQEESFVAQMRQPTGPLVTILPGSRTQEVQANLQAFLQTVRVVRRRCPDARFAIAAFNARQSQYAQQVVQQSTLPISVHVGRTPELIAAADVCLACSGSVSLELLYHVKPTVIHYQVSRLAFFVQRFFRKVRFITLVNLLATENRYCSAGELYDASVDDVPFPEYLTWQDRSRTMADHLVTWLTDPTARDAVCEQLRQLKAGFAVPGASDRAADFLLDELQQRIRPPACLHFSTPRAA